jgi:uncharacterized membrane protein YhaH (DUF805 family)
LTSFRGRIGRGAWGLGQVILLTGILLDLWLRHPEIFTLDSAGNVKATWVDPIVGLIWLVPQTALTVKRFNDTDRPWWFGYAVCGLGAILSLAIDFGFLDVEQLSGVASAFFWLVVAISLAAAIDNSLVRGTSGPNRYGPDPLAAT